LGKIWEKREKRGQQMKRKMIRDKRILLILVTLVVVASLATIWAIVGPVGSPLERQGRERWNLTYERRNQIEQLMEDMRRSGASREEIQAAVQAELQEWGVNPPPLGDIELFYTAKTIISSINATLLVGLLVTYISIYRKTRSEFTIGLIIFSVVLLLYALASNPILHWTFGFGAFGLGPFAMLPDLFTCIALIVLLYLTVKY